MARSLRLLLVEDVEDDELLVLRALRRDGYDLTHHRVERAEAMREALRSRPWDLVISDWSLPEFDALGALAVLRESELDLPLIIVSGTVDEETAIIALRSGARDFLSKSKLSRLPSAVERELREFETRAARRRAEVELQASEARHRALFESSPTPMWAYDKETHRFLAVNEAACRHYGYTADEFLSLRLEDIRPEEDVPALREAILQPVDELQGWRHRKKDGTIIHVELRGHDFVLEGRPARLIIVNDVTERQRLEDQLRQAQKMEAVGRLAGGIAHDFNNVLSVVLTCGEMLLADLPSGSSRADAEDIVKEVKRAAELTKQLLMFSRSNVLAPKIVDLNQILTSVDRMLQRILGADVELVSLPGPALRSVHVDPSSIEQVIMNLVVNARDALPKGGKLTMETANVVLDEAFARDHLGVKPGPHVMLAVTDNGVGMEKATLARLFEPFFTTKGVGRGTGLGLSTVFGIVQQSGGRSGSTASSERARPSRCTFRAWTRTPNARGHFLLPWCAAARRRSCSSRTRIWFAQRRAAYSPAAGIASSRRAMPERRSSLPTSTPSPYTSY
jgi:two-component system cell cycle sensor histidine kinase/response regulator CckA